MGVSSNSDFFTWGRRLSCSPFAAAIGGRWAGWALAVVVMGAGLILPDSVRAAGDRESGRKIFASCTSCHGGPDRMADSAFPVPRLGGQQPGYTIAVLTEIKQGSRTHPQTGPQISDLATQQIEDIAAYLRSFQPDKLSLPGESAASPLARKLDVCRSCHGNRGNSSSSQYPRLDAQDSDYLVRVLKDFRNGKRSNPAMIYVTSELTDEEISAMARFYSTRAEGLVWVE